MSTKIGLATNRAPLVSSKQVSNFTTLISTTTTISTITTTSTTTVKPTSVSITNIVTPKSGESSSIDLEDGEKMRDSDCNATNTNEDPLTQDSNVQSSVVVAAPELDDKQVDQTSPLDKQDNATIDENDQQVENTNGSTVSYDEAEDEDLDETPKQLLEAVDEEANDETLSKRAFIINRGSSISKELRKLKKQRAKLFPKGSALRWKKGKKKFKSTQTRQSSATTASYGNLTPTDQYVRLLQQLKQQQQQQQQQQNQQPSFVSIASSNPISSTLRQHFPSFATNTQQLSSTVQKLIMGKLSPQTSGTRQSSRLVPLQLHADHNNDPQQYPGIVSSAHGEPSGYNINNKSPTSSRLNEVISQWASSDESPIYASSGSLIKQQQVSTSNKNKMIPIEIIGLDPAVTNSIMYGSNEALRENSHSSSDSSQAYQQQTPVSLNADDPDQKHHHHHRHHNHNHEPGIYQPNPIRGGGHLATTKVFERPKASSILHIHHFHTQAKPTTSLVHHQRQIGSSADASSADQQELIVSSGHNSPAAENLLHAIQQQQQPVQQHSQYQQPDRAYKNSLIPQHQQVYVNDRGQLVYLSVEDQNSTSVAAQSRPTDPQEVQQQVEPQSGENQDQASWQTVGLQVESPLNSHDQQSSQQDNVQQQNEYGSGMPESQGLDSQQPQPADSQEQQQQQQQQQHQQQQQQHQQELQPPMPQHQLESNLQQDQAAIQLQAALNSSQSIGNNHPESVNNHHGGILMVPRQIQPHQQFGDPKQTRQVFLATNDDQTTATTIGSMIGRGSRAQHEVQTESPDNKQQQFLMVSYKPKPQQYQSLQNITQYSSDESYGTSTNTRSPYNEGQESKPSLVSANTHPGHQLFKSANILLKPFASNIAHISQPVGHQLIGSSNLNEVPYGGNDITLTRYRPFNFTEPLSHIIMENQNRAVRTNFSSPILQIPSKYQVQENRVPSSPLSPLINHPALKSLLVDDKLNNPTSHSNNTIQGTWLTPLNNQLDNDRFLSNSTNQHQTNLVDNSSLLFRQLQKVRGELQRQQQQQANDGSQVQLKSLLMNSNNSSRILPQEELLSLLHDFRIHNLTSTNGGNLLFGQNNNPFNATFGDSNLATVLRPNLNHNLKYNNNSNNNNNKQNNPTHKFINNNLANSNTTSQQQNGFANSNPKLANNIKQGSFESTLVPIRSLQPIKTQPTIQDYSEFDDASGLSNLALAFIFIISLITLTIIAASMFYRHRRRSSGRCTDLPAQSARKLTRNLTKRTKHFVRSNFITPSHDITSVKSINLDTSTNTLVTSPGSSALNCQDVVRETTSNKPIVEGNHLASDSAANSSVGGYLSKKAFGQTLSTFANGTPISEKYQFTTTQSESSSADIKTLNTRLQKASYLKSLVSAPECLLSGCKKSSSNRAGDSSDSGGGGGGVGVEAGGAYLNVRNRSNNLGHGKQALQQFQQQLKPRSPTEYSYRLSDSSKKFTCDNSNKKHGSPLKDHPIACGISNSSCDKHSDGKNYSKKSTMSTIQSVSDCDTKSSIGNTVVANGNSPVLIKRQSNFACNFGKFNNLPAPKQLVASSLHGIEDRNRGSSDNHSQIDKL